MQEKGISVIFLLLGAALLIGIVGYVYLGIQKTSTLPKITQITPTPNPKVSSQITSQNQKIAWKTYTSKDNLYSIDYPSDYIATQEIASPIISKSPNLISSIQFKAPCDYNDINQKTDKGCAGLEMYHVIVSVEKNINNLNVDEWIKSSKLAPLSNCKEKDPRVKINKQDYLGNQAVVYEYYSDQKVIYGCQIGSFQGDWQTGFIREIVIMHKELVYKISLFYTQENKVFVSELLKIPETLKFLK